MTENKTGADAELPEDIAELETAELDEAAGEAETEAERDPLDELREENAALKDRVLRALADTENLRKRAERDLANAHKFALERFAAELLPVKDSLEMGVAAAADEAADVSRLKEGSELTLKMLAAALEKFNILEINPLNEPFNPEYHEAMSMQERGDVAPNTVVTVVQKGYLLNDRLVRPAMVIVSRAASESPGGKLNEQA